MSKASLGLVGAGVLAALALGGAGRPVDPDVWLAGPSRLYARYGFRDLKGLAAGNWVPAWGGFAVERREGLAVLRPDGTIVGKGQTGSKPWALADDWAVSDDGRLVGESDFTDEAGPSVRVSEVGTGRVVRAFDRRALERALSARSVAAGALGGVAWSPSGKRLAFAHGIGGALDNGGLTESRAGVLDLGTGRIRTWGRGAPVAWISEDRLLIDGAGEAWILGPKGRTSKVMDRTVASAWDGEAVLLFRERGQAMRLERWTPTLGRRLSSRPLPSAEWSDFNDGVFAARRR